MTLAEIALMYRGASRARAAAVDRRDAAAARRHALDRGRVDAAVREAQLEARAAGISGAAVTPFLLAAVTRLTEGASLAANLGVLRAKRRAALAEIATMWCGS